ncbi:MAG: transposase [Coriobacteriia bacterium]|nr:transposase [Coriobacteriia bacterium]
MGRKPIYSPEDKMQIVLSVLRGETTQSDIARRLQMSQTAVAKWQKQFLAGGIEASASSVLRALRRLDLVLPKRHLKERRMLAAARKAAFMDPPTRPDQVLADGLHAVRDEPR